jgi:DNA replicative helicase MCM subunit Mcm2 (Cdc46/Mcm family)
MENKNPLTVIHNDSDLGYFDDYFVKEVRKEIEETLVSIKGEIVEECANCDIEYQSGVFVCISCGKKIQP